MKPVDAARLKLSILDPESPRREVERITSQLARDLTADELADLITQALDDKQQARKELSYAEARLSALMRARQFQHHNLRVK